MPIHPETLDFIRKHQKEDVRQLALQADKYPGVDFPLALRQIAGRAIAALKIPSWYEHEEIRYPAHLSLEQCSSELTARYKSTLMNGGSLLVDLTGGLGVDCAFLSSRFDRVIYVERQEDLSQLAVSNFSTLGLSHVQVYCADALDYLERMEPAACIYLDPARRDREGRKIVRIADCEPNVEELKGRLLEKAPEVWIKFSPMLDISLALEQLPRTTQVYVIAVGNECKELLFKMERDSTLPVEASIHCINLKKSGEGAPFVFTRTEEQQTTGAMAHALQSYLYEPHVALLKAGAYKSLTRRYPVFKLHAHSHLYTSDVLLHDFPGRVFRIVDSFSLNKKESRRALSVLTHAHITVRNFPMTVSELRKKTGLKEGGDAYLFATTLWDDRKCLIWGERNEK